jgi:hypothetical protein
VDNNLGKTLTLSPRQPYSPPPQREIGPETRCAPHAAPARNSGISPLACEQYHIGEEAMMSETWSGEFYCVKCKEKSDFTGEIKVSESGRRMAQGICPVCGTKLNRILGKA